MKKILDSVASLSLDIIQDGVCSSSSPTNNYHSLSPTTPQEKDFRELVGISLKNYSEQTLTSQQGKNNSREDVEVILENQQVSLDGHPSSSDNTIQPSKALEQISLEALRRSNQFVATSKSYSENYEKELPRFAASEVLIGSLLGRGGYTNVHELTSLRLVEDNDDKQPTNDEDHQYTSRSLLKDHVFDESTECYNYAVKFLRQDIVNNRNTFQLAAIDIALEVKILCSIFHPNIIKLQGLCSSGELGFRSGKPEDFFLIMDRLQETLGQRIDIWKQQETHHKGFSLRKISGVRKVKADNIPMEKLKIILDITSALKYLHEKNIIYRDIKPNNFGFDSQGTIKLFDFGLSKELTSCPKFQDGTYKLTGGIGSQRYMAPEVCKYQPYNLSADVYSFTIMLWEMLTMQKPFQGFNNEQHIKLVAYGTYRPTISKSIPKPVRSLLENGWSSNVNDRPDFTKIRESFSDIVLSQNESHLQASNFRR